jgi:hypothetical protein
VLYGLLGQQRRISLYSMLPPTTAGRETYRHRMKRERREYSVLAGLSTEVEG